MDSFSAPATSENRTQNLGKSSWTNQYWYAYSDYLRSKFSERVYKITVSAGFTCPTRDGTRGNAGCAFCDERGSASFFSSGQAGIAIRDQLLEAIPRVKARFSAQKYMAYFQSFTNTYGPLKYLQEVYDGALNVPDVIGMAVGTRPDCVPNEVLALLNQYGRDRYVALELGLQSFDDETLTFYDRGHSVEEGIDAVRRALKFENLKINVHLMFGSEPEMRLTPKERLELAKNAALQVNALNVHGVKIHQLMILKDTVLATRFAVKPWPLLTLEEYNNMLRVFLEHLSPDIHIDRTHALTSHPEELVGPEWSSGRFNPANHLKKLMEAHGSRQGLHYDFQEKILKH